MKRKLFLLLLTLLMLPLAPRGVVLAVDTSDATLVGTVTVTNNTGIDVTDGVAWFEMSSYQLTQANIMTSDTLNIEVKDVAGNVVPFMPGLDIVPVFGCAYIESAVTTDASADCVDVGADDVELLGNDLTLVADDGFALVSELQFNRIWFDIAVTPQMAGDDWALTWEYCYDLACPEEDSAGDWEPLSNVVDNTNGFKNIGLNSVSFDLPGGNQNPTFVGLEAFNTVVWNEFFLVRARVTDVGSGTFTVAPSASQVWVERAVGILYIASLLNGDSVAFDVFVGQSEKRDFFPAFPGSGPMIFIGDDPALEPGSDFAFEFEVYLNVEDVDNEVIFYKGPNSTSNSVIRVFADQGDIVACLNSVCLTSENNLNGLVKIRVVNDAGGGELFINDVSADTQAQQTISDTTAPYRFHFGRINQLGDNAPVVYVNYTKLEIPVDTLLAHWQMNDLTGGVLVNRANPGKKSPHRFFKWEL